MNICMNIDNEERKQITNSKELVDYILENANDAGKMSDEKRSQMDAQIIAKFQSGKKLTPKEMELKK